MRTLTLLAALLLLALQAQTQTLQETADQVSSQEQPKAEDIWAEDQDQAGDNDQDVAMSFTGEEHFTQAVGLWKLRRCTCRPNRFCKSFESPSGTCYIYGQRYKRCCR
ncbi:PREDICTED: defensin-5-like [Myotis brandtii]|uniref:defensin-5-like n=1 Tax=Myotis brandtii TaxID=109478 RepID=UPI000703F430|nr:PREDICTED: defensin-5-like [Myotis brandtii]